MSANESTPPSDLAIAQAAELATIAEIAEAAGLRASEWAPYGHYKAKVSLSAIRARHRGPQGRYIDVTALTPTPLGEGKTATTIGLAQGLARLGHRTFATIRQPSLGPTFGIKGGAAGGGYSQVVPMTDFNLHLTGDTHAVAAAHNLLAAAIDNHLHHGNALGIQPHTITWPRVVDISDRALRQVAVGLGGAPNRPTREAGFDIAVASEVMAILALATDLRDLRERLGRVVIGTGADHQPVTAEMLKVAGAMTVLLRDALEPTLMQTLEKTPALVHAGPFANIAHGNSSVVADQLALRLGDYVVTESGFGADIGFEKFAHIKCRASGLRPDCVVLVATVRALKMHGGAGRVVAGKPLPDELTREDLEALDRGAANLRAHLAIVRKFGVPVVCAVNRFTTDTDREVARVCEVAREAGAADATVTEHWARGGAGAEELARAVERTCAQEADFRYLYDLEQPIEEKLHTIATQVYGADGIDISPTAARRIRTYTRRGWDKLPVCMAKTHLSLSHDPDAKGAPSGFRLPIRDLRASMGAGFLYALCGDIFTMPGLPSRPNFERVDVDPETGTIQGLF